ncbi:MAG: hypothetical protein JST58_05030 [Bacteroidetes bacterium]|nr:hypothetical protein [Bacteroidota bacterium]
MKTYPRNIRIGIIISILLLNIATLNAQHAKNIIILGDDISYKLDSGYYDLELRVGMPRVLVKKSIFSKRTNSLVEEIIKISEKSVCYIKYDEKLNVISKGLLTSDTIQKIDIKSTLVDYVNDPLGDKGLMYDHVVSGVLLQQLYKEGYWIEDTVFENKHFIGVGHYSKGLRNENWEFGLPYWQRSGDEKMVVKTQVIKTYSKGIVEKSNNFNAPVNNEALILSGNWYIIQNSGDSIFYISRHYEREDASGLINFYTTHSCEIHFYSWKKNEFKVRNEEWAIKNNILILGDPKNYIKFKIEFLFPNKQGLILREIK